MKNILCILLLFISIKHACGEQVVVPFTFDKIHRPVIEIIIEGESLRFLFDTGAPSALYIPENYLSRMTNKILKNQKITTSDLEGKSYVSDSFIILEANAGKAVLKNLESLHYHELGMSLGEGTMPEKFPIAGVTLFNGYGVLINYKKENIILKSGEDSHPGSEWYMLAPENIHDDKLLLDVKNEQMKNHTLVVDTGASLTIIRKDRVPAYIPTYPCEGHYKGCRMIKIKIPYHDGFVNSYAIIADIQVDTEYDGLLGTQFFMDFMFYYDMKNKKMGIKQHEQRWRK